MRYVRENPDYQAMFSDKLLKDAHVTRKMLKEIISDARGILNPQRVDRMMWFMRLLRLGMYGTPAYNELYYSSRPTEIEPLYKTYKDAIKKYNRKATRHGADPLYVSDSYEMRGIQLAWIPPGLYYEGDDILRHVQHFMALNLPCINEIPFGWKRPDTLLEEMRECEEAWQDQLERYKRLLPIKSPFPVFLETSNPNFVWFNSESDSCEYDLEAMGDCAHDEGATLLLLWERVEQEGEEYWLPRVRSSWFENSDGKIGQIKGAANSKPKEKYWPYILEMLYDERIKGVKKGTWNVENDFSVTWLTEEEQDEVAVTKSTLFLLPDYIQKFGITEELKSFLVGADLVGANLAEADLIGANLRWANLEGTILEEE